MPAVPLKDRWWRSKPKFDPNENWCTLWADQTPLNAAWHGMESMNHLYKKDAVNWSALAPDDPYVMDKLGACGYCKQWEPSAIRDPIDIPPMPTNKKGEVSSHFYKKMWIAHVFGTVIPVMHRQLLDAIAEDLDDQVLIGDVYILGGERIKDLVSVLDRRRVPRRHVYGKSAFSHAGMDGFRPCGGCGRIDKNRLDPGYLLTAEIESRSPRVLWASLLISPETRRKNTFQDRQKWPSLRITEVPQLDVPADPLPTPLPATWDGLAESLDRLGISLPIRKLSTADPSCDGAWNHERIDRLGRDACVTGTSEQLYWTMTFYIRYRALFEPKVAERVDHWTDEQLYNFVKDSHDFSQGRTPYFPI